MSPVESVLAKVDVERACEVMHDAYQPCHADVLLELANGGTR